MKYNLDGKIFQSIENTENGEVSSETLFHYHQDDNIISADYSGGSIIKGHLLGKMSEDGTLEFTYHHINLEGNLMLGKCTSVPTLLPDGRLKLSEQWQWLSGDKSMGKSQIIEIDSV
ncbi:n-acetylglutamate synthase [Prosthecochloris marina]|uniref:N-acetylglutamate synthase n=1 Tax=Prosthecochloris marina TaxID=2017681 RepID=A0A317T6C7_9CHLB|nr:n-acetylglutamate synthase [Prosthecochloris marina]PWW82168.1 n-acetylglutamate synthase [Prosthecochloris marina]